MAILILLYNVFIKLYTIGIRVASTWNEKAELWVTGRQQQAQELRLLANNTRRVTWMHCASLGEFEQGRPVLEALRAAYPDHYYLVTFFSPSGYEVQKHYKGADKVLYLPAPSKKEALNFISIVNPSLVLWVKYEYWYHYLAALHESKVPVLLLSAIFRNRQPFFHWYGAMHRRMLGFFKHLFVQDDESLTLLQQLNQPLAATVSGDTRFDRVVEIAKGMKGIPEIEHFRGSSALLVAGSTWREDEEEMDHYCNQTSTLKTVIAPHHINEERLQEIEKLFHHTVRFSRLAAMNPEDYADFNVLIIDNIGMLSRLYYYATICYVGGGFGHDGVHNVLEAAVYGKPVIHGPVYEKYREAIELVQAGGAFPVSTAIEMEKLCDRLMSDGSYYANACAASSTYVHSNSGATKIIVDYIRRNGVSPVE